jgi:VWFA-related protein
MRYCSLLLIAILSPAAAQTPDEPVLRTTTRLVQINVIVTKGNEPVPGLKKEDFQVFDNGKRQEIRQFSEETRALLPSSAQPLPAGTFTNELAQRPGTPAAVTAILLDGVNTSFDDQSYARLQVIRFLKQIQPEDRIAIYTLDNRGLRMLHNYTTDSADLVAKLAKYQGEIPSTDVVGQSAVSDLLGGWIGSGGGSAEREFYLNNRIQATFRAIEFIAHNLSTLPGRKNLIWVSAAFPLQIGFLHPPGNIGPSATLPQASTAGHPGPAPGVSARNFPSGLREQRTWTDEEDRVVRALNNANLAIYPVDARGLVASASARMGSRVYANQSTMLDLASRTGGRAFVNSNDIKGAIQTAVADSALTYTLGFYAENAKLDNSFHTLKVKLTDFPRLNLRYRRGYLDLNAPPQDERQRRAALADSVYSPMDANGIGLRASLRQTAAGIEVTLQVDPKSILLEPNGDHWAGKLDLLFVQKEPHGKQVAGVDDTLSMELSQPNYNRVEQDGLQYRKTIARDSQASELRVVVRDAATGAVGSITAPFTEIPSQP